MLATNIDESFDLRPPVSALQAPCTPIGIRQLTLKKRADKEIGETLAFWNVVPPAFGPSLHTATASTQAIQWSASSCPEANAEITSNTRSEKPRRFRMSPRATAARA